jgi:hypothetical protein
LLEVVFAVGFAGSLEAVAIVFPLEFRACCYLAAYAFGYEGCLTVLLLLLFGIAVVLVCLFG